MTKNKDMTDASEAMSATESSCALPTPSFMEIVSEAPVFRATAQVSDRLAPTWNKAINERELLSIYALLAYVAHNQNVRQDLVQMVVEAEFGVDHVTKIRREDYERAIAFLVDLRLDEVLN